MTFEELKVWAKEHKTELIAGAVVIAAFTAGCKVCKNKMELKAHEAEGQKILKAIEDSVPNLPSGNNSQRIDEDIFTRLAPMLEDAILEEGLDEYHDEVIYDVKYPKCGDISNGVYNVMKHVTIDMKDIGTTESDVAEHELEKMWGKNWNKVLEILAEQKQVDMWDTFGTKTMEKSNELVRKVR